MNRFLFSTWVPSSARIGRKVKPGYWGLGIVIHSNAQIEMGCVIAQNVTIGRKEGGEAIPVLEDRVYVGAGACILGDVSIGHDSIILANSVVVKSIPPRSVAAAIPATVLRAWTDSEIVSWRRRREE